MKIDCLILRRFRGIHELELPLDGQLTVLAGVNGSGTGMRISNTIRPTLLTIAGRVRHYGNGKIKTPEEDFDAQLIGVLNLSYCRLEENRKAIVDAVIAKLQNRTGHCSPREIRLIRDESTKLDRDGKFPEYFGLLARGYGV
jgi:predicted ATP-binding protein involved in virulence